MRIGVILVNYGQTQATLKCLSALGKQAYEQFEVCVVDNASPDFSIEELACAQQQCPQPVYVLANKCNAGFAGGCNTGIEYLKANKDCDAFWLLNNDTIPDPNALKFLVEKMLSDDRLGMIGSHLLYSGTEQKTQALGGRIRWSLGFTEHIYSEKMLSKIDYIVGASILIRNQVIEECGLLNTDYFLYFEETDYALKVQSKNWKIATALKSKVYHEVSLSMSSTVKLYYTTRNQLLFWKKHCLLFIPMAFMFIITMRLLPHWKHKRHLRSILLGIFDFFKNQYGLCPHRL